MRRFLPIILIGLIFLFIPMIASAQPKPAYGGSLAIAQGVEPPGLDPTTATSAAIPRVVYSNVLEGLLKIDRNGRVVTALAQDYKFTRDGKTYTFLLKKGVTFHDGKPFDAEDVKFTLERLMDPKTGTAHPEYYKDIESVQKMDKYTVRIKLKNANSMFLFNLARPDSVIVKKEAADGGARPAGRRGAGGKR